MITPPEAIDYSNFTLSLDNQRWIFHYTYTKRILSLGARFLYRAQALGLIHDIPYLLRESKLGCRRSNQRNLVGFSNTERIVFQKGIQPIFSHHSLMQAVCIWCSGWGDHPLPFYWDGRSIAYFSAQNHLIQMKFLLHFLSQSSTDLRIADYNQYAYTF